MNLRPCALKAQRVGDFANGLFAWKTAIRLRDLSNGGDDLITVEIAD
jgi:hypothetical protein